MMYFVPSICLVICDAFKMFQTNDLLTYYENNLIRVMWVTCH